MLNELFFLLHCSNAERKLIKRMVNDLQRSTMPGDDALRMVLKLRIDKANAHVYHEPKSVRIKA